MNARTGGDQVVEPMCGSGRGLSRAQRIVPSRLFREAYDHGKCLRGRLLTMWLRAGPGAALRLGVVTGRRVGEACVRTRARRLMREAYRLNRSKFIGGFDVVLSARSNICSAKMQDVEAELMALARRAGILKTQSRRDQPKEVPQVSQIARIDKKTTMSQPVSHQCNQ